jgi:hypothetical protein
MLKAPVCSCRGPGYVLSWVTRWVYNGQTVGGILYVRVYHGEMEDQYGSFLDLIPFRLAAPPLQPGMVWRHPVQGVWLPSRLPLEGTGCI